MAYNKVVYGNETLIDLTADTVTPENLLSGYSAHDRSGEQIEGVAVIPTKVSELENDMGYAETESPEFTGEPKAPNPTPDTNSTRIATTAYVKTIIAELIGGAPETMDTLKEVHDAIEQHKDVTDALDAAIGNKLNKTGDSSDVTTTFSSGDVGDGEATAWTSVAKLTSGETHKSIFGKLSTMFKNIRYLYKLLGTADISAIGDGTVTGAINALNTGIKRFVDVELLYKGSYLVEPNVITEIEINGSRKNAHVICIEYLKDRSTKCLMILTNYSGFNSYGTLYDGKPVRFSYSADNLVVLNTPIGITVTKIIKLY